MGRPPKNPVTDQTEKPENPFEGTPTPVDEKKEPLEASAEDVLIPEKSGTVEFGGKVVEIRPLSLKAALKVGRFISKHISAIFKSEAYQGAVKSPVVRSDMEVFSGIAMELIERLDEVEIAELISAITQEDIEFVKENMTAVGVLGVIRAFLQTSDFKRIFLELRELAEALKNTK